MSFSDVPNAAGFSYDSRTPIRGATTIFTITDNITKVYGKHTFKAGITIMRTRAWKGNQGNNFSGAFQFGKDVNNPLDTNYAYGNAIQGIYQTYQEASAKPGADFRSGSFEEYVQDSWKVSPKLTLELGIRFTEWRPWFQRSYRQSGFDPGAWNQANASLLYAPGLNAAGQRVAVNPVTGAQFPAVMIGGLVPGVGSPLDGLRLSTDAGVPQGLTKVQSITPGPRFGFAYDPFGNGKTSVRGGFGISALPQTQINTSVQSQPPYAYRPTAYYGTLSTFLSAAGAIFPSNVQGTDWSQLVQMYSFSLGVQRDVGFATVVDVAFVGNLGRHTLQTGEPQVVPEFIARRRDRNVVEYYEWQVHRIPLPDGRRGVVCYFRDISRTVLAREALREADSRKDEFLATLSHELRNPLAPLRSSLEVVKRLASVPPNASAALDIMDRQMSHLVRLVDDLLEVSRITRGQVELRREQVRLDAAIRSAIETSEPLIRAGLHRLIVSFPDEPLLLDADPVRLAQIFGNLLNNAAKYSDRGGRIEVTVRRDGQEAVVTIRDSGDGIAPEQLAKLFEIFTRGERSSRRNQSGLGIGLALVRRLTEMHGGRVEASSDGVGMGSCFSVRLPLSVKEIAATKAGRRVHSSIDELSVLVVDDNKDAAESLAMLLRTAGAEIHIAHDGPTALAAFERSEPHVVLLDIGMPDMDGCEVARRLREIARPERVALVALTGWGQDEDRRRVREAGFDHHLVKPVELAALQALLAALPRRRRVAAAEGALHEDAVDPAAELEADRGQVAGGREAHPPM